jgi:hypothetical protein
MQSSFGIIFRRRKRVAGRSCADGNAVRHGARRLDVGVIFDLTGSYRAAFVNGIAWNALNVSIAFWLLKRSRGSVAACARVSALCETVCASVARPCLAIV